MNRINKDLRPKSFSNNKDSLSNKQTNLISHSKKTKSEIPKND